MMIIEVEERFCKAAKMFSKLLNKVQRAAERGDAVHEVEEMTWGDLIEMGRETIVAFIEEQKEELPRPKVIEHDGKQLQRLPGRSGGLLATGVPPNSSSPPAKGPRLGGVGGGG